MAEGQEHKWKHARLFRSGFRTDTLLSALFYWQITWGNIKCPYGTSKLHDKGYIYRVGWSTGVPRCFFWTVMPTSRTKVTRWIWNSMVLKKQEVNHIQKPSQTHRTNELFYLTILSQRPHHLVTQSPGKISAQNILQDINSYSSQTTWGLASNCHLLNSQAVLFILMAWLH